MKTLKIILIIFFFCFLTVLTQIGGIVFFFSIATHKYIVKKVQHKFKRIVFKIGVLLLMYLGTTFFIVPLLAKPFGRVPLPVLQQGSLRPLHVITCLLNRHYVRLSLKQAAIDVSIQMNDKYPGTIVNYLDAGFPFINKFPLFPHLSHNDGKKLDLAFFYSSSKTGEALNTTPSPIGYGICEEPLPGEINMTEVCESQGYHLYSFLRRLVPQGNKQFYVFDANRTRYMVNCFASLPQVGKIFIEPHLKIRLHLSNDKIRFQGCHAVRHDDHVHIQLY